MREKDPAQKPAVFVDRDGTLVEEVNFLSRVEDLRVFPFAAEALRLLRDNGFRIIVITNQSGIGRKIFDRAAMLAVHDEISRQLPGAIDAFYHCPHLPGSGCRCRKPNTGLVEDACEQLPIDLENSWFVGDKDLDIETGFNARTATALVLTGYGAEHSRKLRRRPDIVAADLLEAAKAIVERSKGKVEEAAGGE